MQQDSYEPESRPDIGKRSEAADPAADSVPQPPSTPSPSTPEPSLRFPTPQGSQHLANWVHNSDPDIMRVTTTTEDTGLSDSAYELIVGTDSESQDGYITESVGGSEAGTEAEPEPEGDKGRGLTFTREEILNDDTLPESSQGPSSGEVSFDDTFHYTEGNQDNQDVADSVVCEESCSSDSSVEEDDEEDDEEDEDDEDDENEEGEDEDDEDDSDEEYHAVFKARSAALAQHLIRPRQRSFAMRQAEEYADELLNGPTIPSRPRTPSPQSQKRRVISQKVWEDAQALYDDYKEHSVPWRAIASVLILFSMMIVLNPGLWFPSAGEAVATTETTHWKTVTQPASTVHHTETLTVHTSESLPLPSSAATAASDVAKEFTTLHAGKVYSGEVISKRDILVKAPDTVKWLWFLGDPVDIWVTRGAKKIEATIDYVNKDFLVHLPKGQAHGVITINVLTGTTVHPIQVDLGHAPLGSFTLIDDLSRIWDRVTSDNMTVPSLNLSLARSWFGDARGKSQIFLADAYNASTHVFETAPAFFANTTRRVTSLIPQQLYAAPYEGMKARLKEAQRGFLDQLSSKTYAKAATEIAVKKAQIASKLWWLKATGRFEAAEQYEEKAKVFLRDMKVELDSLKTRETRTPSRSRKDKDFERRCRKGGSFGRWTQQCRHLN